MKKLFPIAIVLLLSACYAENEEELFPQKMEKEISFTADIKPILAGNCTFSGCHSGGNPSAPGNWNLYADLKARVDNGKFNVKVLDPGYTMPKGMPENLDPSKRELLRKWVEQGAKNN